LIPGCEPCRFIHHAAVSAVAYGPIESNYTTAEAPLLSRSTPSRDKHRMTPRAGHTVLVPPEAECSFDCGDATMVRRRTCLPTDWHQATAAPRGRLPRSVRVDDGVIRTSHSSLAFRQSRVSFQRCSASLSFDVASRSNVVERGRPFMAASAPPRVLLYEQAARVTGNAPGDGGAACGSSAPRSKTPAP
jgi:hypothetical protein